MHRVHGPQQPDSGNQVGLWNCFAVCPMISQRYLYLLTARGPSSNHYEPRLSSSWHGVSGLFASAITRTGRLGPRSPPRLESQSQSSKKTCPMFRLKLLLLQARPTSPRLSLRLVPMTSAMRTPSQFLKPELPCTESCLTLRMTLRKIDATGAHCSPEIAMGLGAMFIITVVTIVTQ